jgi:large subunit ribosomal protein L29
MKSDKIRNLTDVELEHQERELADQLFKLKFQLNMGQTESLKKIRGLRKDIARVKTIQGERGRTAVSVTTASATKASATEKR